MGSDQSYGAMGPCKKQKGDFLEGIRGVGGGEI